MVWDIAQFGSAQLVSVVCGSCVRCVWMTPFLPCRKSSWYFAFVVVECKASCIVIRTNHGRSTKINSQQSSQPRLVSMISHKNASGMLCLVYFWWNFCFQLFRLFFSHFRSHFYRKKVIIKGKGGFSTLPQSLLITEKSGFFTSSEKSWNFVTSPNFLFEKRFFDI